MPQINPMNWLGLLVFVNRLLVCLGVKINYMVCIRAGVANRAKKKTLSELKRINLKV